MIVAGNAFGATYDWVGTSMTGGVYNWNNKLNWQINGVTATAVPGAADIVRIAVNSYTNDPTITDTQTCASMTFGVYDNFTLTINGTLTVVGDITQNNDPNFYQYTTLSGTGTLSCNNFKVGDNTLPSAATGVVTNISCQVNQMTIKGNLTLNATGNSTGDGIAYPFFSLDANKLTLYGQIYTVTYNNPLMQGVGDPAYPGVGLFQMDSYATATTLELLNNNPIALPITTGFTIDFTNDGAGAGTVIYDATSGTQAVYATGTTGLGINSYNYDYLTFAGASKKMITSGALTIGADWTSGGTGAIDLNTNNPIISVKNNWVNSTDVTQGTGNITITNIMQNNSNTVTLGSGSFTVNNILQINFGTIKTGSGTTTVAGIFQNNSGTLTCGAGSVIFKGTYSNSGTFTAGSGTIYFSGASQILVDYSSAGSVFNKVTFNGSGTATMSAGVGNFSVSGTGILTLVSPAKLTAGSATTAYLTLKSTATSSASIAALTGTSTITGNVNVQRYLTGGSSSYRGYRLLSSPVNAGTVAGNKVYSINYLKSSSYITGTAGTSGGMDKAGNPTIYLYRENIPPGNSSFTVGNYRGINNINSSPGYALDGETGNFNIPIGSGYLFFFRGNRSTSLTSKTVAPYATPENTTLTASGTLNQGAITAKDWYTPASVNLGNTNTAGNASIRGFNLLGNPYASSIDWDTYSTTNSAAGIYATSVSPSVYVLDPVTKNYGVYTQGSGGIGTHNATNILPSGQGFFVMATTSAAKLTFNETAKVNTQVAGLNLLMGMPVNYTNIQYMRLQLIKDSINNDEIIIRFNNNTSAGFSPNEDAPYQQGYGAETLASLSSDSIKLAINQMPLPKKSAIIPLAVNMNNDGSYQINMKNIVGIPQIYSIRLTDAYTKDTVDMRETLIYNFNVLKSDTNTYGSKRFNLIIGENSALMYHLLSFNAAKVASQKGMQVQLTWKAEHEENYTSFTVERSTDNGQNFEVVGGLRSAGLGTYSLADNYPVEGQNLYRLKQVDINDSTIYSDVVRIEYSRQSNNLAVNNINVYPNPASSYINLAISPAFKASSFNIKITNSLGLVIKETSSDQLNWQTSIGHLHTGTYFILVTNNKDQSLVGKTKFVKL